MKLLQFKSSDIAALALAVLLVMSTSVFAHYQSGTQTGSQSSQNDINNAGSPAQVRHDRTGSLNPGNTGSKGNTGYTGKKGSKGTTGTTGPTGQ